MLTDVPESVWEAVRRRLLDPFVGTLLLSSLLWNWKPILILFFDQPRMLDRIEFVTKYFWSDWQGMLWSSAPPLAFTLFWFFVYPRIARVLLRFYDGQALKTRKVRADLAATPDFKPKLEQYEQDRKKMSVAEPFLFELYRQTRGITAATLAIVRCPNAEVGDWVRRETTSARLAVSRESDPIYANAIVLHVFTESFVLIQDGGNAVLSAFPDYAKSSPPVDVPLLLSSTPGKMEVREPKRGDQILGRFKESGGVIAFSIELTTHS